MYRPQDGCAHRAPELGRTTVSAVSTAPLAVWTVLWEETAPALYNLSTATTKIALKDPLFTEEGNECEGSQLEKPENDGFVPSRQEGV